MQGQNKESLIKVLLMNVMNMTCYFGGGGYLDYWIPNSSTGTTFDISAKSLEEINTPTFLKSWLCSWKKNSTWE